jgi:hypothetical protein
MFKSPEALYVEKHNKKIKGIYWKDNSVFVLKGVYKYGICHSIIVCRMISEQRNVVQKRIVSCGIPRWRLEVGSRKRASYSVILERRWRHTLQA